MFGGSNDLFGFRGSDPLELAMKAASAGAAARKAAATGAAAPGAAVTGAERLVWFRGSDPLELQFHAYGTSFLQFALPHILI